jgi:hypothetical protein
VSATAPPLISFHDLATTEEIAQLKARGVVRVGTMDSILLNALCPLFANCAGFGIGRICCSHQFAQIGNRVVLFQSQDHNRTAGHEGGQRIKKWPAGMHGVKALGLLLGNHHHAHADDAEAILQNHVDDIAGCALGYRVRLHNRKSSLQSLHVLVASPEVVLGRSVNVRVKALFGWLDAGPVKKRLRNHRRRLGHVNAGCLQRLDLLVSRAVPAGNNGSGMAHAASGRRGLSGNE